MKKLSLSLIAVALMSSAGMGLADGGFCITNATNVGSSLSIGYYLACNMGDGTTATGNFSLPVGNGCTLVTGIPEITCPSSSTPLIGITSVNGKNIGLQGVPLTGSTAKIESKGDGGFAVYYGSGTQATKK